MPGPTDHKSPLGLISEEKSGRHQHRLVDLDYSVLQQCMHCGMCLPTCPTYVETKLERHSPRGRIALMRSIADGRLEVTPAFADEMYYCLGCLACETACPAGVNYAELFETARAEVEEKRVLPVGQRNFWRWLTLRFLFLRPRLLRLVGRLLWVYQASGLQALMRRTGVFRLLPEGLRNLEPQTPTVARSFSPDLIPPTLSARGEKRYRVGLLTGCIQDLVFSEVNRDTAEVLAANGCEVITPPVQPCCGSLHAHNGAMDLSVLLARRLIDLFPPAEFDAIISNAGGCGSHLKHFSSLLGGDPQYAAAAKLWDAKLRDIHEWLVEISFRPPTASPQHEELVLTYHESCHLTHGQKVVTAPRKILRSLPGVRFVELPESSWCCGSAGIYNITQPATSAWLQERKTQHICSTGAQAVATSNPGCHLQLQGGLRQAHASTEVTQPVTLLAAAYRREAAE
jgi:glycolate oxidase iron-sulfur subunit